MQEHVISYQIYLNVTKFFVARLFKISKTFNTFFDPPKNCDLKECGQRKLITRSDDNEETIVKRLKTYDEKTFPVLDYYLKKGIMKNIDGMQEINAISDQLFTIIRAVRS